MSDTALHINTAAMGLNDAVNHRKPQAGSLADGFGRKEGIETLFDGFALHPLTAVRDDELGVIADLFGLDTQLPAGGHGIPRIGAQIHQGLAYSGIIS